MTTATAGERIPLSIVTGFLGSGKTTLIAALLTQPSMQGTAVVVNEFGAVGIDDAIIAETLDDRDLLLLKNGCLCCTVRDDLGRTLWALTRRAGGQPRRILIETTGVADPVLLLHRLIGDPRLRPAIRLDAVIATVDAVHGLNNLADQPVAARQGAIADRRLITKVDLAEPDELAALSESLRALNPGAPIWPVSHGAIAAEKLFGASLYNDASGEAELDRWLNLPEYRRHNEHEAVGGPNGPHLHGDAAHLASVRSWLVEEARPVDWDGFSPRLGAIVSRYGRSMLRVKGVVWTADDPRPLVIHGVQQLFHTPVRLRKWSGQSGTSIVVIGERTAAVAARLIREALAESAVSCASPYPAAVAESSTEV